MDEIGKINEYVRRDERGQVTHLFHTINLAAGYVNSCLGRETQFPYPAGSLTPAASNNYALTVKVVTARWGWYRPSPAEFKLLADHAKFYVLNGGLLLDRLDGAVAKNCHIALSADHYTAMDQLKRLYETVEMRFAPGAITPDNIDPDTIGTV